MENYLRLASDIRTRENFVTRSKVLRFARRFLEDTHDFLEVDINRSAAAFSLPASQRPEAEHDQDHLLTPGESLKYSIIGGMERVYEGYANAQAEPDAWPHYLGSQILECYMTPADVDQMMSLVETLVSRMAFYLHSTHIVPWQLLEPMRVRPDEDADADNADSQMFAENYAEDILIDLTLPWPRRPFYELVDEVTGVDFQKLESVRDALDASRRVGVDLDGLDPSGSIESVAMRVIDQLISPTLIQPTFLTHYPHSAFPDAKRSRTDQRLAEHAELFINGMCFAKAFSVSTSPREQSKGGGKDAGFASALRYGMPPTGGLQIGIEHLAMLMTGASSLRDVAFFPMHDWKNGD